MMGRRPSATIPPWIALGRHNGGIQAARQRSSHDDDRRAQKIRISRRRDPDQGRALSFAQLGRFAPPALIDGSVGVIVAPAGRLRNVLRLTIAEGRIAEIEIIAEPSRLRQLDLALLEN